MKVYIQLKATDVNTDINTTGTSKMRMTIRDYIVNHENLTYTSLRYFL